MSFRNRKAKEYCFIDMKKVKNLLRSLKPDIIIYKSIQNVIENRFYKHWRVTGK